MSYKNESGTFEVPLNSHKENSPQLKLFYQRWVPIDNAKTGRNVVLHHGLGEHSDRYTNILNMLEGTGATIYTYDVRGHGRSEGKKGLAVDIYQLAEDLNHFLEFINKEYNVSKPILQGNSMGGATSLAFVGQSNANQEKVKAVIATGSALAVDKNCYQSVMSGLLSCLRKIIPSVCLASGLDTNKLSHDKTVVEDFKADKMAHDMIGVSLAFSILEDGHRRIIPSAKNVTVPIFLAHGGDDAITSPEGTKDYYESCGSQQKTLKIYPGLYHEIHNETKEEREKVLADMKEFIVKYL